jgi:hypothetical protein
MGALCSGKSENPESINTGRNSAKPENNGSVPKIAYSIDNKSGAIINATPEKVFKHNLLMIYLEITDR